MKNLCLPIIIILLFATSCSKEKKTLNNIAGQWNVTSYEVHSANGTTNVLGQNSMVMDFESCESGSTCSMYISTTVTSLSTTLVDTITYSISKNTNAEIELSK